MDMTECAGDISSPEAGITSNTRMQEMDKHELQWVHNQLLNLVNEARHCGSDEAEKLLLTFSAITSIAMDHGADT